MDWICKQSEVYGNLPELVLGPLKPEIRYFKLSEETKETLNKVCGSSLSSCEIKMAVITDYRDDIDEIREDEGIIICATGSIIAKRFNARPYLSIKDMPKYNEILGYNEETGKNEKSIDFDIYYTDDEVFASMELGRVLEISSLEKLDKKLSEAKATTFVKE